MALNPTYTIVNSASISQATIDLLLGVANQAFLMWGEVLAGDANLSVRIELLNSTSSGRAQGGWGNGINIGLVDGVNLVIGAPAYELQTGQNLSGSGQDIVLQFSRDYLLSELFLDPTPAERNDLPSDRTDGLSVLLHEIGHALGFIGYYNTSTNQQGSFATTYDLRRLDIDGEDYFRGPNVETLLGTDLELTTGNYTHYGNNDAFPGTSNDPLTGLMNGVVYYRGYAYTIDDLVLAVLADTGLGTIRNDVLDNPRHDYLRGGSGDDRILGGDIDNHLFGDSGHDVVAGAGGNDTMSGGTGRDVLNGGSGDDLLNGGSGIDTASFENASAGVIVTLNLQGVAQNTRAEGNDTLVSIEDLFGSDFSDRLEGDVEANTLDGGDGSDRLFGDEGDDTLLGGLGSDRLFGGVGFDSLEGGAGNDVYYLDADPLGATVLELTGEGRDVVWAGFDYTLGENVENLQLLTGDWQGTGNALNNRITAGDGLNTLAGLDGNDFLTGGNDRDFLHGDSGNDRLQGGNDRDSLYGGAGNDRLFGGSGHDGLIGGAGRDRFIFENADALASSVENSDRIRDFDRTEGDRINLSLIDANSNTAGDDAFAFIGTGAFSGTAGELRYSFDAGRTVIEMDRDGDGLGDLFLRLEGEIDVVARDFYF